MKTTNILKYHKILFYILNSFLRFIGALAEPFMPSFSAKLYEIMNVKYEGDSLKLLGVINEYLKSIGNDVSWQVVKKGKPSAQQSFVFNVLIWDDPSK